MGDIFYSVFSISMIVYAFVGFPWFLIHVTNKERQRNGMPTLREDWHEWRTKEKAIEQDYQDVVRMINDA